MRSVPRHVIEAAATVATLSNHKYKVGAVIFSKNKIISVGHNVVNFYSALSSSTTWKNNLHAEHMAVLRAGATRLIASKGVSVYVHRLNNSGVKSLLARPCLNCMSILASAGVNHVFYSTADGGVAYERVLED